MIGPGWPGLLPALGVLFPAILTGAWAVVSLPQLPAMGAPDLAGSVSSILAQNGLVLLVILVLLGSRNALVEPFLGLGRMLRGHKRLAMVALGLLLAHVLLQGWRFYLLGGLDLVRAALLSMDLWEMVAGRTALLLLLIAAFPAFLGTRLHLSFRVWKPLHLLVYAAVPLALAHARFRGNTMAEVPQAPVWVVLVAALALAVIMRLVMVLRGKRWRVCQVVRVVPENHDTTSVYLRAPSGDRDLALRRAGQFALLRIPRGRGFSEPHPFTIANQPAEAQLRFTIKRAGQFTRQLHDLPPGAVVRCEGPYGIFCARAAGRASLALIAGGVGVTPFLSLLRHFPATGRAVPTVLVWANKTYRDIFALEELADMARRMPLQVIHVLSREKKDADRSMAGLGVSFERGRISADILRRYLTAEETFYLCGPPAMQTAILVELKRVFGLRPRQVSQERFFL